MAEPRRKHSIMQYMLPLHLAFVKSFAVSKKEVDLRQAWSESR